MTLWRGLGVGALERFYQVVASYPCLRCGKPGPSEVAHIQAVASTRTKGAFLPRSHQGAAAFGAIPLCPDCHRHAGDAIHAGRERDWLEEHIPGGRAYAVGFALRCLVEVVLDGED